jgi:hypothetical protein
VRGQPLTFAQASGLLIGYWPRSAAGLLAHNPDWPRSRLLSALALPTTGGRSRNAFLAQNTSTRRGTPMVRATPTSPSRGRAAAPRRGSGTRLQDIFTRASSHGSRFRTTAYPSMSASGPCTATTAPAPMSAPRRHERQADAGPPRSADRATRWRSDDRAQSEMDGFRTSCGGP